MSLYRHVRNKDELIALMADAALGELPLGELPLDEPLPKYDVVAASGRYPYFAKMLRDIPEDFTLDVDDEHAAAGVRGARAASRRRAGPR